MNRALLAELQRRREYPSVTVLCNTTAGLVPDATVLDTLERLVEDADRRLRDDVADDVRTGVVGALRQLVAAERVEPSGAALAVCASPSFTASVKLARAVHERVVIDDTFATRDLVADLNRTALYRLITISDRVVRHFVGDRQRLAEERDDGWPLRRADEQSATSWAASIQQALRALHAASPLPTVIGGVQRSVRRHAAALGPLSTIGVVAGNHDRASPVELHHATWPLVSDWLRGDRSVALARLEAARSARRYAGGIHEVWPLAREGRIDLLVVEETFALAARLDELEQLHPATDVEAPDVIDDVVDEAIEAVLRAGGRVVMTTDGELADHDHVAAIVRY